MGREPAFPPSARRLALLREERRLERKLMRLMRERAPSAKVEAVKVQLRALAAADAAEWPRGCGGA